MLITVSSHAGIDILEIDWTQFKGAHVITTEMKGSDAYTKVFLNESGHILRLEVYSEGKLFSMTVYDYDVNGRIARKVRFSDAARSHPGNMVTYSYNNQAHSWEEETLMPDGSLLSRTVFKGNEKGQPEMESYYLADGSLEERIVYSYNENGDVVLKTGYHIDGKVFSVNKFTYDEHHNPLSWSVIENGKSTNYSYAYDYDNNGNWVRRTEMSDLGSLSQTIELTIEY